MTQYDPMQTDQPSTSHYDSVCRISVIVRHNVEGSVKRADIDLELLLDKETKQPFLQRGGHGPLRPISTESGELDRKAIAGVLAIGWKGFYNIPVQDEVMHDENKPVLDSLVREFREVIERYNREHP